MDIACDPVSDIYFFRVGTLSSARDPDQKYMYSICMVGIAFFYVLHTFRRKHYTLLLYNC